jgi:hypothetical protein
VWKRIIERTEFTVLFHTLSITYDHRVWKTGLPVRSAVLKPHGGELVEDYRKDGIYSPTEILVAFSSFSSPVFTGGPTT